MVNECPIQNEFMKAHYMRQSVMVVDLMVTKQNSRKLLIVLMHFSNHKTKSQTIKGIALQVQLLN